MNSIKTSFLPAFSSAFTMIIAAAIWHEAVMPQLYTRAAESHHEGTGLIFAAYLILGFFMTFAWQQWGNKKNSILTGFLFGAFIGILWVFPHELAMAGAHSEPLAYVFQNGAWHFFEQGVGGIALALVFKKGS